MVDPVFVRVWELPADKRAAMTRAFHDGVYREGFPELDETETAETWLPLMAADAPSESPRVRLIVAESQVPGPIAGGIVFEQYRGTGVWLLTYITVATAHRGEGLARRLMGVMLDVIREVCGAAPWWLLAEMEKPEKRPPADRPQAFRRLRTLANLGFRKLPIAYVQPALGPKQKQLDTLDLMQWVPAGTEQAEPIDPVALSAFLRALYTSLGQANDQSLLTILAFIEANGLNELLPMVAPARYDDTLGGARAITLRMTFVARHLGEQGHARPLDDVAGEIPLDQIQPAPSGSGIWKTLSDPIESFHKDIVVPFASVSSRPLILQCQPFRPDPGADHCVPLDIKINFPATLKMEWEGEERPINFACTDEQHWEIDARMVDSVAIFESGYIAYSVALVFGHSGPGGTRLNAQALLALASIANPAGRLVGEPIRIVLPSQHAGSIDAVLRDRLRWLHDHVGTDPGTVFSGLRAARRPALGRAISAALLAMRFPNPAANDPGNTRVSISMEVIGATLHDRIIAMAEAASQRNAPVNDFTKRLAGLAQNVMDFEEQDAIEVYDSLDGAHAMGSELTFAQKDLTIRFSKSSRAFDRMWPVVGGEPYWMLVELILSHNARLLSDLNQELRGEQGADGLSAMLNNLLFVGQPIDTAEAREAAQTRLARTQRRRIRLAHYIPNLFRYPTEQSLYEQFAKARGLGLQRDYFRQIENTMEQMLREVARLNAAIADDDRRKANESRQKAEDARQAADGQRNSLLALIGVVQTTTVFAAFASVFAAVASIPDDPGRTLSAEAQSVFKEPKLWEILTDIWDSKAFPDEWRGAWGLLPALTLTGTSLGFMVSASLIYFFRGLGATLALVLAVLLGVAVLADSIPFFAQILPSKLVEHSPSPGVRVALAICAAGGALPAMLWLHWRRKSASPAR